LLTNKTYHSAIEIGSIELEDKVEQTLTVANRNKTHTHTQK